MKQDSAVDPCVWFSRTPMKIRWSEQWQAEAVPPGQALKYVSFAVQMLGKSFKMLPVTGKKLEGDTCGLGRNKS